MRFSIIFVAAIATMTFAHPNRYAVQRMEKRSLLTLVTSTIGDLTDSLGVTALEDQLDSLLGGSLSKLEDKLGITFAEKLLGLSEEGASPGDLQAIGKGVYYLEKGLGIADVNDFLDAVTGGTVTSLEKALGVTDLEAALGIAP